MTRHPRRKWVVGGAAAAIAVAVVGAGIWYSSNDESGDQIAIGSSDGGPAVAVADVGNLLDTQSYDTEPNSGAEATDGVGSLYEYADGVWTASYDDGIEARISRPGTTAARSYVDGETLVFVLVDQPRIQSRVWAEEVLDTTPGLQRSGDEWRTGDSDALVNALEMGDPEGGFWSLGPGQLPILIDELETRFLFSVPSETYAWAYDDVEDVALLIVVDDSERIVAGLAKDDGNSVRFAAGPTLSPGAQQAVDAALEELSASVTVVAAGPDGDFVVAAPIAPSGDGIVAAGPSTLAFGIGGWIKDKWQESKEATGGLIGSGWTQVKRGSDFTWDTIVRPTLTRPDLATIEWLKILGGDVAILWDGATNLNWDWTSNLLEKDCGTAGPGPAGNESGAPAFSQRFVEPPQMPLRASSPFPGGPTSAQQQELLELARIWMPTVKLSNNERCGHILRVVAKVFPYAEKGNLVNDLRQATRVEITYTVFFKEDGGRFDRALQRFSNSPGVSSLPWLGGAITGASGAHPGDNEGFSIGLIRSDLDQGRCGMTQGYNFEMYAAQSAAHMDAALGLLKRAHDDIEAETWAGRCPQPGIDDNYFVWVGENKHGIYFHQNVCEAEVLYTEECEDGRAPYDLSSWVELVASTNIYQACWKVDGAGDRCTGHEMWPLCRDGDRSGDPDSYNLSGNLQAYACSARGTPRHTPPQQFDDVISWSPAFESDYWVRHGFYEVPVSMPVPPPEPQPEPTPTSESLSKLPDLYGMTFDEAAAALAAVGLDIQLDGYQSVSDASLIDRVVDQHIPPGGRVEPGRTIGVWLGQTETVPVPDLGGFELSVAQDKTASVGLDLQVAGTLAADPDDAGRVLDQDPIGGTVPVGSVIRVWVGEAPSEPPPESPPPESSPPIPPPSGGQLRHDGIGGVSDYCSSSTCPSGVLPFGVSSSVPLDVLGSAYGAPDEYTDWVDAWGSFGACPGTQVLGIRWGALWVLMTDGATEYSSSPHFFGWTYDDGYYEMYHLRSEYGVGLGDTVASVPTNWFRMEQDPVYGGWYMNFGPNLDDPRSVAYTSGSGASDYVTYLRGGIGCGE